jgi:hypothetical protein
VAATPGGLSGVIGVNAYFLRVSYAGAGWRMKYEDWRFFGKNVAPIIEKY